MGGGSAWCRGSRGNVISWDGGFGISRLRARGYR